MNDPLAVHTKVSLNLNLMSLCSEYIKSIRACKADLARTVSVVIKVGNKLCSRLLSQEHVCKILHSYFYKDVCLQIPCNEDQRKVM